MLRERCGQQASRSRATATLQDYSVSCSVMPGMMVIIAKLILRSSCKSQLLGQGITMQVRLQLSSQALEPDSQNLTTKRLMITRLGGYIMLPKDRSHQVPKERTRACASRDGSIELFSGSEVDVDSFDLLRDRRAPSSYALLSRILRRCCRLFMACSRLCTVIQQVSAGRRGRSSLSRSAPLATNFAATHEALADGTTGYWCSFQREQYSNDP